MGPNDESFRPLRLRGGRFEIAPGGRVGFPLEAIAELTRYERLLIQVARSHWKTQHPKRVRVPKGFDDHLRLRLTEVEGGSVAPVLELQESDEALLGGRYLIREAQTSIGDALQAVVDGEALPDGFPPDAASTLVLFGSSFRDDEACEIHRPTGPSVRYTQEERRHLLRLVSPEDVKIDGRLVGRVSGFEANKQTFTFSDRKGQRAEGSFEQIGMIELFRRVADRDAVAPFVRLSCRYSTTENGHLSRIEDVEDVETIIGRDDPLGAELRALLELRIGWDDDFAPAPTLVSVEWVRDFAAECDASELSRLVVGPTHEGGVLLEQQTGGGRWSLEVDPEGEAIVITVPLRGSPSMTNISSPEKAAASLRQDAP